MLGNIVGVVTPDLRCKFCALWEAVNLRLDAGIILMLNATGERSQSARMNVCAERRCLQASVTPLSLVTLHRRIDLILIQRRFDRI